MTTTSLLSPSAPPGKHHVFLIDDSEAMRALYRHFLEHDGYRVTVAADGRSGLAALERDVPDLILLDHMMPGMSGAEVLHRIRRHPVLASVPTVFLTASALEVAEAFDLGATDYFTKPIDRRMLLARVRALITTHLQEKNSSRAKALEAQYAHLLSEISGARSVQRAQLPQMPVSWGEFTVTGALVPCNDLGGDTFDILRGPAGEPTISLVDVSGHGFAAAMVASGIQGMLRLLVQDFSPAAAMAELNRLIAAGADEHYACVALVSLVGDTVHVVNAGLPPVLVISEGEVVWSAEGSGFPPGLLPEASYEVHSFVLQPGMRLVLSSDGITEPFGVGQQTPHFLAKLGLDERRLAAEDFEPTTLCNKLARLFADAGLAQEDDATVVVLDRGPQRA